MKATPRPKVSASRILAFLKLSICSKPAASGKTVRRMNRFIQRLGFQISQIANVLYPGIDWTIMIHNDRERFEASLALDDSPTCPSCNSPSPVRTKSEAAGLQHAFCLEIPMPSDPVLVAERVWISDDQAPPEAAQSMEQRKFRLQTDQGSVKTRSVMTSKKNRRSILPVCPFPFLRGRATTRYRTASCCRYARIRISDHVRVLMWQIAANSRARRKDRPKDEHAADFLKRT
jgi:hypothetical protein